MADCSSIAVTFHQEKLNGSEDVGQKFSDRSGPGARERIVTRRGGALVGSGRNPSSARFRTHHRYESNHHDRFISLVGR